MFEGICIKRYLDMLIHPDEIIRYDLPNEENGNTSIVLRTMKAKVCLESIKSSIGNCISVQLEENRDQKHSWKFSTTLTYIIHEVHAP